MTEIARRRQDRLAPVCSRIALALYGASKGAGAIVTALNIAYEVEEDRGFIKSHPARRWR